MTDAGMFRLPMCKPRGAIGALGGEHDIDFVPARGKGVHHRSIVAQIMRVIQYEEKLHARPFIVSMGCDSSASGFQNVGPSRTAVSLTLLES